MRTLTDVRAAATKQFVKVKVTDVKGRTSQTAIVSATSLPDQPRSSSSSTGRGSGPTAFDTSLYIERGSGACAQAGACQYKLTGWTQRAAGRTRNQVPLRELRNDTGTLTFAILLGKGSLVGALALGGTWEKRAVIQLCDARIRW